MHQGPHLGAHLTIALPFNDLLWGADEKVREYHRAYGAVPAQVRVAVGLEGWEELKGVVEGGLRGAEGEAGREEGEEAAGGKE